MELTRLLVSKPVCWLHPSDPDTLRGVRWSEVCTRQPRLRKIKESGGISLHYGLGPWGQVCVCVCLGKSVFLSNQFIFLFMCQIFQSIQACLRQTSQKVNFKCPDSSFMSTSLVESRCFVQTSVPVHHWFPALSVWSYSIRCGHDSSPTVYWLPPGGWLQDSLPPPCKWMGPGTIIPYVNNLCRNSKNALFSSCFLWHCHLFL